MTTFATVEAKSHFSEMIERASKGEEIVITKRGLPVVKVVAYEKTAKEEIETFLSKMADFRASLSSPQTTKPLLKQGQSWSEFAHENHQW